MVEFNPVRLKRNIESGAEYEIMAPCLMPSTPPWLSKKALFRSLHAGLVVKSEVRSGRQGGLRCFWRKMRHDPLRVSAVDEVKAARICDIGNLRGPVRR